MSLVAATGIPSPSEGVWYLGPLPLRAYGIIIAIGMVVGVWWTARRYVARGGSSDTDLRRRSVGDPAGRRRSPPVPRRHLA